MTRELDRLLALHAAGRPPEGIRIDYDPPVDMLPCNVPFAHGPGGRVVMAETVGDGG